ncbi:leishmanolysin-like peptidase, partial [Clonorchis sinensis]
MLTVFVILTAVDAVSIRSVLKSKVRSARQPTDTSIQVATSTAFKDGVKIRVTVGNKLDANEKKRDPFLAIIAASEEWSETLRVRTKPANPLLFPRDCVEGDKEYTKLGIVCRKGCLEHTSCGPFTFEKQTVCNDGTQSPTSAQVDPDQGELQIIFEELDVSLCTSGLITADYCATDPLTDRPILGYIGLCPDAYMKSVETLKTLFRRAIGRILGFNKKAFAFLRDETGEPRTSRDPSTNRPNNGQDAFGIYTPSSSYLFYKTMSGATVVGRVENSYLFLALPTLVEYARKYFAYPQLEGIPLEDEGGLDVVEQYFDSRFVSHDVMTSGTDTVTGITGFTLAYMYDSGWYEISDAHEFAGTWGKGKGEDFFNKSCFEYTTVRKSQKLPLTPYCTWMEVTAPACRAYPDSYGYCDIKEDNNSPLIFHTIPPPLNIRLQTSNYFAVSQLRNNCPIISEDVSMTAYDRISQKCTIPLSSFDFDQSKNFALESFGETSRCIDHHPREPWTLETANGTKKLNYGASCHLHECHPSKGLLFKIGDSWTVCPVEGGYVTTQVNSDLGTLKGKFYCPACNVLCVEDLCEAVKSGDVYVPPTTIVVNTTTASPSTTTVILTSEEIVPSKAPATTTVGTSGKDKPEAASEEPAKILPVTGSFTENN